MLKPYLGLRVCEICVASSNISASVLRPSRQGSGGHGNLVMAPFGDSTERFQTELKFAGTADVIVNIFLG